MSLPRDRLRSEEEDPALHKKSGQKSDAAVNKDFPVPF